MVMEDANGFVAKNVLRPRTGSGATQDRHASGGMPLTYAAELRELLAETNKYGPPRREWYLLFRKLEPVTHDAKLLLIDGKEHEISQAAVSEIAAYGAFLTHPGPTTEPLINECAGLAARTRPASTQHELTSSLGYGALSLIATEEGEEQDAPERC